MEDGFLHSDVDLRYEHQLIVEEFERIEKEVEFWRITTRDQER
jgi:hypothetical protein